MTTLTQVCLLSSAFAVLHRPPHMAHAQPTLGTERGSVMVGAFVTDRNSHARLDSASGLGTDIDLEDDLGLQSSMSVARIGGHVWIGRRHRFDASYFDLSRDAARALRESVTFGDETFTVDTILETEQSLVIVKADYSFAALARDEGFLAVTGGLYVARTTLSLSEVSLGRFETEALTAPLPLLGLRGELAVSQRLTLGGAVQWFALSTDKYEGRLTELYVGLDYSFSERIAAGLAYNSVSTNLGSHGKSGYSGRWDWGYNGALLYLKLQLGSRP